MEYPKGQSISVRRVRKALNRPEEQPQTNSKHRKEGVVKVRFKPTRKGMSIL